MKLKYHRCRIAKSLESEPHSISVIHYNPEHTNKLLLVGQV